MNLKAAFSFALNRCLNSHFGPLTLSIALQLLPGHHLCNRTRRCNMQKHVCAPLFVQALISSSCCRAKMRGQGGATTPAACIKQGVGSLLSPAPVIDCRFPRLLGVAVTALRGARVSASLQHLVLKSPRHSCRKGAGLVSITKKVRAPWVCGRQLGDIPVRGRTAWDCRQSTLISLLSCYFPPRWSNADAGNLLRPFWRCSCCHLVCGSCKHGSHAEQWKKRISKYFTKHILL